MGRHFGDLAVIRGIIYYKLSPYEQKPLAGAIMHGAPNMVYRVTSNIVYWLPPFTATYHNGTELNTRTWVYKVRFDYPFGDYLRDLMFVITAMVIGVLTYKYVEQSYHASKRKNLKDYENEVDPSPKLKPCKDKKPAQKE